jgi:hypothetical protein
LRPRLAIATLLSCLAAPAAGADELLDRWRDRVTFTLSERVRGEFVDWFRPPAGAAPSGAEGYNFFASQLRAGARVVLPHVQLTFELQDTRLVNLPDDASLPAPIGNLGTGATYFAHTRRTDQGEPFLKQGFVTFRRGGLFASAGRLEIRDGLETVPGDATLAQLKRMRIGERLVGMFDFSHVTRSFDAVKVAWDRPGWNLTGFGTRPTHGGFEVSANRELDVSLAGLSLTLKRLPGAPPADVRAFYVYYDDRRDAPLKVDNRGMTTRMLDDDAVAVHTGGGHAVTVMDAGPGMVDLLGWTALQAGSWGEQDHQAWAWALEAGYQLPRLFAAPWLRVGWNRSSGDDDPDDALHETFFQVLPTSRVYALLPFYNLMNSDDVFAQLIVRPHQRVTLRTDWHWLRVTEPHDLWYSGSGATNDDVFGFSGSPASGSRELAHLVDLSVSVTILRQLVFQAYYGHAFGGSVVGETFAGRDANYGFVELAYRR